MRSAGDHSGDGDKASSDSFHSNGVVGGFHFLSHQRGSLEARPFTENELGKIQEPSVFRWPGPERSQSQRAGEPTEVTLGTALPPKSSPIHEQHGAKRLGTKQNVVKSG